MKSYKGLFTPTNPQKYRGDPKRIVYRSMLEKRFFKIIDSNPAFAYWSSEEMHVPYISPIDEKPHRYFVDLIVEMKSGKKYMVEIKPYSQTIPPKPPKTSRGKTRYLNERATYEINCAKWHAAKAFCKKQGMEFMFLTEKELPKVLNG